MLSRLCVALALVVPGLAAANDAFAEFGVGGLTLGKTDQISMDSEKLSISVDKVEVEYEFVSLSKNDQKVTIAFPLPPVVVCTKQAADFGHCYDEPLFALKFDTWIDGNKIAPAKSTERVVVGGKDVSKLLAKHGLSRVHDPDKVMKLSEAARTELEKASLISWDSSRIPLLNWKVERVYYWEQTFKAGERVRIRHEYKPISGGAVGWPMDASFCIDESTKRGIDLRTQQLRKPNGGMVGHSWVKYVLKSATTWAGPIRAFELTVHKATPGTIISTCFKGLAKVDDLTFVAKLSDFVPTEDLTVVFF